MGLDLLQESTIMVDPMVTMVVALRNHGMGIQSRIGTVPDTQTTLVNLIHMMIWLILLTIEQTTAR